MYKDFLYYLIEEDGRSLSRVGNIVSSSSTKRPLNMTPEGWQEVAVAWERNLSKYFGLTRNFSLPLSFIGDPAFILRDQVIKTNIERKIFLLIQQLQLDYGPDFYKFIYRYLYKGQLDLSTVKGTEDKLTCNIMEGGLVKQFKNAETTVETIPFDDDAIYIFMDGIEIFKKQNFLTQSGLGGADRLLGVFTTNSEGASTGVAFTDVLAQFAPGDYSTSTEYFMAVRADISGIRISGRIIISTAGGGSIVLKSSLGNDINLGTFGPSNSLVEFDATFDAANGENFFLLIDAATILVYTVQETEFSVSLTTRAPASSVQGYKPADAFKRLVGKATGNNDNASSSLLEANKNLILTCGDAIRGVPAATIKTSPSDFLEDYSITCFGGLSIDNGKINFEDRATFFDSSNPIPLGKVRKFAWSGASDLLGNVIKVGSIKPEIDDVNGKFDPNGSSLLKTPISTVVKDIDLVGPYKKGPYEIETLRINLEGKTTTDDNSDNQCFVIDAIEPAPVTESLRFLEIGSVFRIPEGNPVKIGMRLKVKGTALNDQSFTILAVATISGHQICITDGTFVDELDVVATVIFPHILDRTPVVTADPEVCPSPETIFNVRLAPKNLFFKQQRWIHSIMHGFESEKIKWSSSDKNSKFIATVDGKVMDEDRDENISDLGPKLFLPTYFDFETLAPTNYEGKTLVELMEENPNRCFEFETEDGFIFKGFSVKTGFSPNTLKPEDFKLLSTPDNDLTQLIP